MVTTSAATLSLAIGVTLIGGTLIALNAWLCIMLARQVAESRRILRCLHRAEWPQQGADLADVGRRTRFLDDWTTSGAVLTSGARTTGSASRT